MTSRATYLRLSPLTNRWTRTTRPFNLSKHARPLPAPPARTKGVKEPFETLAADLTPVPGVQVPRLEAGAREGVPRAGMAVEGDGQAMPVGAGEGQKVKAEQSTTKGKAWMGVEIPLKPAAPEEGGEFALFSSCPSFPKADRLDITGASRRMLHVRLRRLRLRPLPLRPRTLPTLPRLGPQSNHGSSRCASSTREGAEDEGVAGRVG